MRILIGIALGALLITGGCLAGKKIQQPEFLGINNLGVGDLGLKQSRLTADLFFYNPNKYGMQLKKAELDYFVNEKKAGFTVLDTLIQIPANDTFKINVNLNIDMKNVFDNAMSIFQKNSIYLSMTGNVRVGRNGIFFTVPVKYAGEQKLPWKKGIDEGSAVGSAPGD